MNYENFKELLYSYVSKDNLSFVEATKKVLKKKPKRPRKSRFGHSNRFGRYYDRYIHNDDFIDEY